MSSLDFSQCPELQDTTLECAAALITSGDPESIDSAILSAHLARQHTPDITLLTNGLIQLEQHPQIITAVKRGFKIDTRPIQSFAKEEAQSSVNVEFADGTKVGYGFIAHKPRSAVTGTFSEQLDLEMTAESRILVEGDYHETSVRGVFAAGSCASVIDSEAVELSTGITTGIGANFQIVEDDVGF
jgi:thioredoxin reductase